MRKNRFCTSENLLLSVRRLSTVKKSHGLVFIGVYSCPFVVDTVPGFPLPPSRGDGGRVRLSSHAIGGILTDENSLQSCGRVLTLAVLLPVIERLDKIVALASWFR